MSAILFKAFCIRKRIILWTTVHDIRWQGPASSYFQHVTYFRHCVRAVCGLTVREAKLCCVTFSCRMLWIPWMAAAILREPLGGSVAHILWRPYQDSVVSGTNRQTAPGQMHGMWCRNGLIYSTFIYPGSVHNKSPSFKGDDLIHTIASYTEDREHKTTNI